jgi:chemotaxis methyl-accepting protein methylase
LARKGELAIDGADINGRVIDFIQGFPRGDRRLELYSSGGDEDYARYFGRLGESIGKRRGDVLMVDANIAAAVHAERLNILTSRWDRKYDLAIATNVLVYFNTDELVLALANMTSMLAPGGWLLHNEVRPEVDAIAADAGLDAVHARTVRVGGLFDAVALYRKR